MKADGKIPLYKRIADEIAARLKAGLYRAEGFIPGESEVSREFKASRITVRGAMKILEEAGLVEAVPGKGRRIAGQGRPPRRAGKPGRKLRISCAVENASLQAYQLLINVINNMALDDGAVFSVHFVGESYFQSNFERMMSSEESDGLLCVGVNDAKLIAKVDSCGMPSIHVNSSSPLAANVIATDDFAGGYMIGSHLASKGHRKLLMLTLPGCGGLFGFKSRELGVRCAYQERFGDDGGVEALELGFGPNALDKIFRMKSRPKAVFMVSDMLAKPLFEAMDGAGLAMPRDLSVAGFDNMVNVPREWKRDIDSIDQPWPEIAERAYLLLRQMMERREPASRPPMKILLRPRLVLHGSVAVHS